MTVTLNSYDLCVSGFERLRKQSEFMLVVPVSNTDTRADICEALHADLQSCMREDDFDWDGAKTMIDEHFGSRPAELFAPELEDVGEDEEGCSLYLYCEQV